MYIVHFSSHLKFAPRGKPANPSPPPSFFPTTSPSPPHLPVAPLIHSDTDQVPIRSPTPVALHRRPARDTFDRHVKGGFHHHSKKAHDQGRGQDSLSILKHNSGGGGVAGRTAPEPHPFQPQGLPPISNPLFIGGQLLPGVA